MPGAERRDLPFQLRHQFARLDGRDGRNVVDRLFRIQRRALPAHLGERVDQHRAQLQHAELEDGEQADRPGADDGDVGFERLLSCRHPSKPLL